MGFLIICINLVNSRFLYGGIGKEISKNVDMIDLTSENMKWQRVPFSNEGYKISK